MVPITLSTRPRLLLSLQRALLGAVTASLRGIAVACTEDEAAVRFIYDDDEGDYLELVQDVETEVLADFCEDFTVEFSFETAPRESAPLLLMDGEVWAFLRREE